MLYKYLQWKNAPSLQLMNDMFIESVINHTFQVLQISLYVRFNCIFSF